MSFLHEKSKSSKGCPVQEHSLSTKLSNPLSSIAAKPRVQLHCRKENIFIRFLLIQPFPSLVIFLSSLRSPSAWRSGRTPGTPRSSSAAAAITATPRPATSPTTRCCAGRACSGHGAWAGGPPGTLLRLLRGSTSREWTSTGGQKGRSSLNSWRTEWSTWAFLRQDTVPLLQYFSSNISMEWGELICKKWWSQKTKHYDNAFCFVGSGLGCLFLLVCFWFFFHLPRVTWSVFNAFHYHPSLCWDGRLVRQHVSHVHI